MTLLPNNATPFDLAVSETNAERWPLLNATVISDVWNPDRCPVHLLGWLANQLSVDVWNEAWPETHKRNVCRNSFKLHRLKTTPAGIKAHVALTGSTVLKIIRPPAKGFMKAAISEEDRLAWYAQMPQIRVYPYFNRVTAKARSFYNGHAGKQFHSKGWLRANRGRELIGFRATYFDNGAESDAAYQEDADGTRRIFVPPPASRARTFYNHGWAGRGRYVASRADDYVVTTNVNESLGIRAISRGLQVIDIRPERIYQKRTAPKSRGFYGLHDSIKTGRQMGYLEADSETAGGIEAAMGQLLSPSEGTALDLGRRRAILNGLSAGLHRGPRHRLSTFAPQLVYDQITLLDKKRMAPRHTVRSYWGFGRYGIDPYSAEIKVRVPMKRSRLRSGRFLGAGFRAPADYTPMYEAIKAIRSAKAFRDTVRVNTTTYGTVSFGGSLKFGDFTFGEIREV